MTRKTSSILPQLWAGLPSFLLAVLLIVPPFGGTLTLYRAALFLFALHTVITVLRQPRPLDRPVKIILALAVAFTIWSLLSALCGIDPKYSRRAWFSEHFYMFLLFSAVLLNPSGYRLELILWGGCISILMIALGVAVDQWLMTPLASTMLTQVRLWKVAYLKGFSSDITWITNHLVMLFWIAPVTLLVRRPREPLFWAGAAATLAGLWIVVQTFQGMVFFIISASTFVFLTIWLWRRFRMPPKWLAAGACVLIVGAVAFRDLALYPDKKVSEGLFQALTTGRTENLHIQSRLNGVRWAIHKSTERPLLGWGPGREILRKVEPKTFDITERDVPDFATHPPLGHLHNQYADLLVRIGYPGLLLYVALLAAIFCSGFGAKPWKADWKLDPGSALRLGAMVGAAFALFRLVTETYPASSVAVQYWLLLAFAALPASAFRSTASQRR